MAGGAGQEWATLPGRAGQPGVRCALGAGAWALGTKGGLSREGQEKVEVHLRLVPGKDEGARVGHPHDGQPIGRSVCSFPRSQASRSTFIKRRDYPPSGPG